MAVLNRMNPKNYFADFGNFKQGFLNMKLIQKNYIQGSGYVFSTIVLRKTRMVPISGNHMHAFHTGCLKKTEFYQIEHLEILLPVGKKYL